MPRVTVVGDVISDVIVRLTEPLHWNSDTPARISSAGGGSAANTAAWLAHLGVGTTLFGRVGDDLPGRSLCAELSAGGVQLRCAVDPTLPTGSLVSLVASNGERSMLVDRGANDALHPDDITQDSFVGSAFHLSGYALLHAGSRRAALYAIGLARAHGCLVSVDPSSVEPLLAAGADNFLAWTAGADICVPNLDEARVLTGCDSAADAARALSRSYPAVVVTCGADGATAYVDGELLHEPAATAEVVDTTGAGDAYAAGLLAARLAGSTWPQSLRLAAATAATAVSGAGARPSHRTR